MKEHRRKGGRNIHERRETNDKSTILKKLITSHKNRMWRKEKAGHKRKRFRRKKISTRKEGKLIKKHKTDPRYFTNHK